MENNQAHKIDKIFKNSLDNQSIMPPADAWVAVHTYTIGQEESKKRVWLRYAVLGLVVLLFSGLGAYYLNLDSPDLRISGSDSQRKIQKSINPVDSKLNDINSNISISKSNKKIRESKNLHGATFRNPNSDNINLKISTIISNKKIHKSFNLHDATTRNPNTDFFSHKLLVENSNKDKDDKNTNRVLNPTNVEKFAYSNDNIISPNSEKQIENIESKPLVLNDLSEKMQKECERKIIALEENIVDKEKVHKVDSVDYRKRFSLKHPIISFGMGSMRSVWDFGNFLGIGNSNSLNNSPLAFKNSPSYYVANGSNIKISIAWKVNKKLRMGFALSANTFKLGIPYRGVNDTSDTVRSNLYLYREFKGNYTAFTPFGFLNIPISSFNNFPTNVPNTLDSVRTVLYPFSHSMRVTTLSVTSQYNLLSKNRKKGKKYGYQIYGLSDLIMQRQTGYSYASLDEKAYLKGLLTSPINNEGYIFQEGNHLEGTTEYTFGLRLGLGFRYQFARKWDLFLEGSGQSNFNSWFKDISLNQRAISIQTGINLNL